MLDWIKKLFTEPTTLGVIVTSALLGLIMGLGAGVNQFENKRWAGIVRAALLGVCVAVIVGLGVADYVKNETARLAIVGACAAIGEDIWCGLKAVGRGMRTDPLGYLSRLLAALRGRPTGGDK